ncbi:MAG: 16S rRNA (cytosine(1402)-N(4))-methyltransferase RsmH [Acidimicrobiia bacterium]
MDQPTSHNSYHQPVMLDETLGWLEPASEGWIVDGTFGGGGHSHAILRRFPLAHVVGIDRDPDALAQAGADERLTVVEGNYRHLDRILDGGRFPAQVQGVLLDLGVSSHQLDEAGRGFSYHSAGPVDMRMGRDADRTAAELIADSDVAELTRILSRYGDERFARRIATAIVDEQPFASTAELADCVARAVPAAARRGKHPARKTFQALRIAVNDELAGVSEAVEIGIERLAPGGRFIVIAYHSLEDRIVKQAFKKHARACECPPDLPICACGADPDVIPLTRKAQKPSAQEIETNPRARSAVMRVVEKRAS